MRTSIWTLLTITALAVCATAALAASATAKSNDLTPRRDGSKAVPFVADVSSSGRLLRRDGSKAVPFVADLGTKSPSTAGGFDWGDAGIGAGAAFALTAIGVGGMLALGSRRNRKARSSDQSGSREVPIEVPM
jgi:hypothetical protein